MQAAIDKRIAATHKTIHTAPFGNGAEVLGAGIQTWEQAAHRVATVNVLVDETLTDGQSV